jgi:hypothetical protein
VHLVPCGHVHVLLGPSSCCLPALCLAVNRAPYNILGFQLQLMAKYVPTQIAGYNATGTAHSVASGRISYMFGFSGPAMTADTGAPLEQQQLLAPHLFPTGCSPHVVAPAPLQPAPPPWSACIWPSMHCC